MLQSFSRSLWYQNGDISQLSIEVEIHYDFINLIVDPNVIWYRKIIASENLTISVLGGTLIHVDPCEHMEAQNTSW